VTVYDPWADVEEVREEYGLTITKELPESKFDAVVLAVAHNEFLEIDLRSKLSDNAVLYDVKAALDKSTVDGRL